VLIIGQNLAQILKSFGQVRIALGLHVLNVVDEQFGQVARNFRIGKKRKVFDFCALRASGRATPPETPTRAFI